MTAFTRSAMPRVSTLALILVTFLASACSSESPSDPGAQNQGDDQSGSGAAPSGTPAVGGRYDGASGAGGAGGGAAASGTGSTGSSGTGGSLPAAPGECQPACGSHKWACWRMPNPVSTGPNPPSYSVENGVVHDQVTCLDWEQTPSGDSFDADGAIAHCEALSLGGKDDWRLPTRVEMSSILDFTRSGSVDEAFTAASGFHKTGSNWILTIEQEGAGTSCGNGDCAWAFNMSDGIVSNAYSAATEGKSRCVRSEGPGESYDEPAVAPPNQYTLLSADEAQDNYTRLIWQRDGAVTELISWEEAVTYCENLELGEKTTWRLPTMRELATLVDEARVAPSIDPVVFPRTHYGARSNNWYWASHKARNSDASWGLNFDDGFTGFNSGAAAWNTFGPSYAKCVRDE